MRLQKFLSYSFVALLATAVILVIGIPSLNSGGVTYIWVAPNGVGNDCTESVPCTLQTGVSQVRNIKANMTHDIIVYLKDGEYVLTQPLTLTTQDSGANGAYIRYIAKNRGSVRITSSQNLGALTLADPAKKIYTAPYNSSQIVRELYNGEHRLIRARKLVSLTYNGSGFSGDLSGVSGDSLEVVGTAEWKQYRCGVNSINGSAVSVKDPCLTYSRAHGYADFNKVSYVEGSCSLLDEENEWCHDRTQNLIKVVLADSAVQTAKIAVPRLEKLVELIGAENNPVHHLSFEGIIFDSSTWYGPNEDVGYVGGQAGYRIVAPGWFVFDTGGWKRQESAVTVKYGNNVKFINNRFTRIGATGLYLDNGSTDAQIIGNTFSETGGTAIHLGNPENHALQNQTPASQNLRNTISNNIVVHPGAIYQDSIGILTLYAAYTNILNNEIYITPYTGISLGWGWEAYPNYSNSNLIEKNIINRTTQALGDGGAIYTLGSQANTIIRTNYIDGMFKSFGGLYFDQGTTGITATQNTLLGITNWLILNIAYSNVLYNNYSTVNTKAVSSMNNNSAQNPQYPNGAYGYHNVGLEGAWQFLRSEAVAPATQNIAYGGQISISGGTPNAGTHSHSLTDGNDKTNPYSFNACISGSGGEDLWYGGGNSGYGGGENSDCLPVVTFQQPISFLLNLNASQQVDKVRLWFDGGENVLKNGNFEVYCSNGSTNLSKALDYGEIYPAIRRAKEYRWNTPQNCSHINVVSTTLSVPIGFTEIEVYNPSSFPVYNFVEQPAPTINPTNTPSTQHPCSVNILATSPNYGGYIGQINSDGPVTIPPGVEYQLNWTSSNATSCRLDSINVAVNGSKGPAGQSLNATTPIIHTITCVNSANIACSDTITMRMPDSPSGLTGTCSANGTLATFSWNAPSGHSYIRNCEVNTSNNTCGAGVSFNNVNNTENYTNNTVTFNTTPGKTYHFWVHGRNPTTGAWSHALSLSAPYLYCPLTVSTPVPSAPTATPVPNTQCTASIKVSDPYIYTTPNSGNLFLHAGSPYTIHHTSNNASSCSLDNASVALNGEKGVNYSNEISKTHTLNCVSTTGQICSSTITIQLPPSQTIVSNICAPDAKTATLSWNNPAGYPISYVRACELVNNACTTTPIQFEPAIDTAHYDKTSATMKIEPGKTYHWWVHSKHPNTAASHPVAGTFTCNSTVTPVSTVAPVSTATNIPNNINTPIPSATIANGMTPTPTPTAINTSTISGNATPTPSDDDDDNEDEHTTPTPPKFNQPIDVIRFIPSSPTIKLLNKKQLELNIENLSHEQNYMYEFKIVVGRKGAKKTYLLKSSKPVLKYALSKIKYAKGSIVYASVRIGVKLNKEESYVYSKFSRTSMLK